MHQEHKQEQVTSTCSLILVKNMLRLSLSSICYQRGIFPGYLFSSKNYAGVNVHQLESADRSAEGKVVVRHPEAFLLTQWLEKGVFEALELGYLKSMIFAVYCNDPKTKEDALLETYQFQVELPKDGKSVIKVNGVPATRDSLKRQAVTFIRALVEFSGTLESLPEDRWLTLKLVYHDEVTPSDYEPEYFKAGTSDTNDPDGKVISNMRFSRQPLRVKIGKVETPHHKMELKFAGLESLLDEDNDMGAIDSKMEAISIEKSSSQNAHGVPESPQQKIVGKPLIAQSFNDTGSIDYNVGESVATVSRKMDQVAMANLDDNDDSPNPQLIMQVKEFIIKTGNCKISDCLEQMQRMQSERIVLERNRKHSLLLSQSQTQNSQEGKIKIDEDEEHLLDREDVKEAFLALTKENFLEKKGHRYARSTGNVCGSKLGAKHSPDDSRCSEAATYDIQKALETSPTTLVNTKRKLSYHDDSHSSGKKNKIYELSQESRDVKTSIIRDPIHQQRLYGQGPSHTTAMM